MEYKAVTKLQMFCLDFHKQHISTRQNRSLFRMRKNNYRYLMSFYETSSNLFHTKRGDWFALCTSTNLTAVTNSYKITIQL